MTDVSVLVEYLPIVLNVTLLIFLSGLFSGSETAFTNLSSARLEAVKNDGKFASKLMHKLYQKLDLVITLNLVLSNGVNILMASYLTNALGPFASFLISTTLVIIFGEIIPKKVAILYPLTFSRFSSYILQVLYIVIFPVIYPLQILNLLLDKAAAKIKSKNEEHEKEMLQEEIKATLGIGHMQGALESKEYQMMQKLLLLNDKMARDIMTPRSDIVAISSQQNLGELVTLASKHSFSRIPVYTDSPDTIEYIIHIPLLSAHLTDPENLQRPVIDFCKKKAFKIPESKIVDDLFFEFQRKRVHMAIVLNEFGETSGLITLEDIVEQIFGEIEDETDEAEVSLEKIEENKLKVQGDTNLEQIEDNLQVSFPEEFPKYKTVGWLILDILHRFPEKGELVEVPGSTIQLEIVSKDEEYIQEVYVTANEDANDE